MDISLYSKIIDQSHQQYDRIDPNDVQALRDEIEDLQIDIKKFEEEKAAREKEAEAQAKLVRNVCFSGTPYLCI